MTVQLPFLTADEIPRRIPGIGELVYLASYMIKTDVSAEHTPPGTPNLYSARLRVMGDQGAMDLDGLTGPSGPVGQARVSLRLQNDPNVSTTADLPDHLTGTPEDVGKYWELDELDDQGNILTTWAYIWYGTSYRKMMVGSPGPPGPVPQITPIMELIPQDADPHIDTSGASLDPTWVYYCPSPDGVVGNVRPVAQFPDVDEVNIPPASGDILGFTGRYSHHGSPIFEPFSLGQQLPGPWSVPESAFAAYSGASQQAAIGSFEIPPQPFPWTPIVWGHLGSGGVHLSAHPLMIGVQVLLADPSNGILIARGMGNTLGEVNIMPHYSTPGAIRKSITPRNRYAVIPANHTNPAMGTIYINLYNDGALGVYDFAPDNAQVFVLVVPVDPLLVPVASKYPAFTGPGFLSANFVKV